MSVLEDFEKYWEAGKFDHAYAGGLLSVVKARMREAFAAGSGSGYNTRIKEEEIEETNRVRAEAGGPLPQEPIRLKVEMHMGKPGEAVLVLGHYNRDHVAASVA